MEPENPYKKTKAQKETEKKMQEGKEQADALGGESYYAGGEDKKGSSTVGKAAEKAGSKGLASAVSKASPAGIALSALSFVRGHKKRFLTGGGILGAVIGVVVTVSTLLTGSQLIWMNNIFGDLHTKPYERNVVSRALMARRAINQPARHDQTKLGSKMQEINSDPSKRAKVQDTKPRKVAKVNRRMLHRSRIGNKINTVRSQTGKPRHKWKIFEGKKPDGSRASPRMKMKGVFKRGEIKKAGNRGRLNNAMEQAREASPRERKSILRRTALRSGITITGAVSTAVCLAAAYDDMLPDDKELYELFLTYGASFNTAGSQAAAGEDMHGEEYSDAMSVYYDEYDTELDAPESEEFEVVDKNEEGEETREEKTVEGDSQQEKETIRNNFAHSAAWKRATNQPVTGNEEDHGFTYGTGLGGLHSAFRSIGGGANFLTGGNASLVCKAASIASIPVFAVEIVATFKTGGLVQAGGKLLTHGAMIGGTIYMMEQLSVGEVMPEGSVMQMASTDAGMNLTQSEYARSQGAPPVSHEEMAAVREANFEKIEEEDKERGFAWRYFSPDNHRSALAQVALASNSFDAGSLLKPFTNFASTIGNAISRAFPKTSAQEDDVFDNYGIKQFHFTGSDADPLDNADYVENTLGCDVESETCSGDSADALRAEIILSKCMPLPYYEMEDNDWTFRDSRDGNTVEVDCRQRTSLYEKVGTWKLDNDIVDGYECLSHDDLCEIQKQQEESQSDDDSDDTAPKLPSGSKQELAQQILNSPSVIVVPKYKGQIQRVSQGQPPCSKEGANMSETILGLIAAMSEDYSFVISSLNRYCSGVLTDSGTSSYHWAQGGGRAVDFSAINGTNIIHATGRDITRKFAHDAAELLPSGSGVGQSNCGLNLNLPPGISHFNDACNHLHIQVP